MGYFFDEIVEQSTLGDENRPTTLVGTNVGYSAASWFITWLCVAWGVRWTGRVTYFTMGLPIVILFVFLGRSLTLEGSIDGVKAYIGEWDMSLLGTKGDIWSTAASQIIFSLSLTGGGIHWVRLLWFNLYLLGIDSAFSGVEGVLIVLRDTALFRGVTNWKLAGGLCLSCFLLSLPMCTDAGFKFLDVFDFYINFMFLLVGFLETFAAGWINGLEEQIESVGVWANVSFAFANFGSILVACGLWFGLDNNNVWAGFFGFIVVDVVFTGVAIALVNQKMKTQDRSLQSGLYDLFLKNVLDFKKELESVIGWVPSVWALGLRFLIPQILLILFVNLARSENAVGQSKFGHYSEFVVFPFQLIGILLVLFIALLFLLGVVAPKYYDCFIPPEVEQILEQTKKKQIKDKEQQPESPKDEEVAV